MGNELLPCPFCGGEGELCTYYGGGEHNETVHTVMCNNDDCQMNVLTPDYLTESEAIAAWNTRAEYHGYEQAAIEAWESIKKWNSRAERTCRIVERQEEPQDGVLVRDYTFSCGHCICWAHTYEPRYCPNCGCKVVD